MDLFAEPGPGAPLAREVKKTPDAVRRFRWNLADREALDDLRWARAHRHEDSEAVGRVCACVLWRLRQVEADRVAAVIESILSERIEGKAA